MARSGPIDLFEGIFRPLMMPVDESFAMTHRPRRAGGPGLARLLERTPASCRPPPRRAGRSSEVARGGFPLRASGSSGVLLPAFGTGMSTRAPPISTAGCTLRAAFPNPFAIPLRLGFAITVLHCDHDVAALPQSSACSPRTQPFSSPNRRALWPWRSSKELRVRKNQASPYASCAGLPTESTYRPRLLPFFRLPVPDLDFSIRSPRCSLATPDLRIVPPRLKLGTFIYLGASGWGTLRSPIRAAMSCNC